MRRVTTIPAITRFDPIISKRKVAGYARVSTDQEEQAISYESQVKYYTNYIKSRADWEFVNLYSDEGISGTNTKHRDGFNKMIDDALAGKIDLIITKSVSRFARNTVDSLMTIRKLKEHNVECYFEKENIWTFDSKGELFITIMSSLAQEESRSISENVIWGRRKRFAEGKVSMSYSKFLGYEKGENGDIVINEKEANIVKLIYSLFLKGYSTYTIARKLEELNIKTVTGKNKWRASTIRSILTNERYKGDALLQKTYTSDFLSKKAKKNKGEIPQYYVENNHPAIIKPEFFELVQIEIKKKDRTSGKNIFSSKIQCKECGSWYGSKVWHSTSKYKRTIYRCNNKYKNGCKTSHVDEEAIKKAFVDSFNKLITEKDEIISNLKILKSDNLTKEQKAIYLEIEKQKKELERLIFENTQKVQDQESYNNKFDKEHKKYEKLLDKYQKINEKVLERKEKSKELESFIKNLEKQENIITEFDEELWCIFVDRAIVGKEIEIVFKALK